MRRLKNNVIEHKAYPTRVTYLCYECLKEFASFEPICKVKCTECGSTVFNIKDLNGNTKI